MTAALQQIGRKGGEYDGIWHIAMMTGECCNRDGSDSNDLCNQCHYMKDIHGNSYMQMMLVTGRD